MVKVATTTHYVEVEGDYGLTEGVEIECDRCGHSEESAGTGEASLKRCGNLLRKNCPRSENNLYDVGP